MPNSSINWEALSAALNGYGNTDRSRYYGRPSLIERENAEVWVTEADSLLDDSELANVTLDSLSKLVGEGGQLSELKPGSYILVNSWQRLAVELALGEEKATLPDVLLYALVWQRTASGKALTDSCVTISAMLCCGEKTVRQSMKRLLARKLIKRLKPNRCTSVKTLTAVKNHPAAVQAQIWGSEQRREGHDRSGQSDVTRENQARNATIKQHRDPERERK